MNSDRILLYASTSPSAKRMSEASDWGIEASTQAPAISHQSFFSALGPPLNSRNSRGRDSWTSSSLRNGSPRIEPIALNSDHLVKFTRKYLSLPSTSRKFKEHINYQIILSCLLEDSMILSKNDQSLAALQKQISLLQLPQRSFTTPVFPDGAILYSLGSNYSLIEYQRMSRPCLVFPILYFIFLLLKQSRLPQGHILVIPKHSQWNIYRILLVVATKLIQYQKFHQHIRSQQAISRLLDFLASNYHFNRRLILGVIALKEDKIFNFLPSTPSNCGLKQDLAVPLLNVLQMATLSAIVCISQVIYLVNGDLLEQYCKVNNLHLQNLGQTTHPGDESPLEAVTRNLQRFHHIRKLLLCTVLSFCDDKLPCHTFYVESIATQCGISSLGKGKSSFCGNIEKMALLHSVLSSVNRTIEACTHHLANNELLLKMTRDSVDDQDVLPSCVPSESTEDSIAALVSKLESLTASFVQFGNIYSKYDRDLDPIKQADKIRVFERFGRDLDLVDHIYRRLQSDMSESQSRPLSLIEPTTNVGLKTFRNASIQNRKSSSRNSLPLSGVRSSMGEADDFTDRPRKYLSGLLIEVVKVAGTCASPAFESPNVVQAVSFDTVTNTSEIDALEVASLSKQELARQLEASFARIYALKNENQRLMASSPLILSELRDNIIPDSELECVDIADVSIPRKQMALLDFIKDLESKLQG